MSLPEGYFDAIEKELQASPADAFGGPDRAHDSFTDIQKAINYSMTSFFTTGGIRGGKKEMDKFYPRSFNMGIRREVYEALGGFSKAASGRYRLQLPVFLKVAILVVFSLTHGYITNVGQT